MRIPVVAIMETHRGRVRPRRLHEPKLVDLFLARGEIRSEISVLGQLCLGELCISAGPYPLTSRVAVQDRHHCIIGYTVKNGVELADPSRVCRFS
jgi:hypothetical protein